MDSVSAFAAYQAAPKKVAKNKSPKAKKQKNSNERAKFVVPTTKTPKKVSEKLFSLLDFFRDKTQ